MKKPVVIVFRRALIKSEITFGRGDRMIQTRKTRANSMIYTKQGPFILYLLRKTVFP